MCCSLVLLFTFTANVFGQQLTAKQQQIFKSVLAVDAQLTKDQYDQFWADFPKLTPEERKELYKKLEPVMLLDLERQRGVWMRQGEHRLADASGQEKMRLKPNS